MIESTVMTQSAALLRRVTRNNHLSDIHDLRHHQIQHMHLLMCEKGWISFLIQFH